MANCVLVHRVGRLVAVAVVLLGSVFLACRPEKTNYIERLKGLGLEHLEGQTEAYYSRNAESRTKKLQAMIEDMNAFYQRRLGIKAEVTLAVLDSSDWTKINSFPYGFPNICGKPRVVFMPATSGGMAYQQVMARREAIPPEALQAYVESNNTTLEAAADQFVNLIGFHELGHQLCYRYGIDPQVCWLGEFVATYFLYAYLSEGKPEMKPVFDLLGGPSKVRPKNTSLDDFERLYDEVDDYAWYQGMFEAGVRELYPKMGLKFLEELRRRFPVSATASTEHRANREPVKHASPADILDAVEQLAPGFQAWAKGFRE